MTDCEKYKNLCDRFARRMADLRYRDYEAKAEIDNNEIEKLLTELGYEMYSDGEFDYGWLRK